ncbi:hypothetical protein L571_2214 [Bordetella pertussis 2371640]|nr:hypothetical protein L571_2214 [Bordetella pertussis 2371640]
MNAFSSIARNTLTSGKTRPVRRQARRAALVSQPGPPAGRGASFLALGPKDAPVRHATWRACRATRGVVSPVTGLVSSMGTALRCSPNTTPDCNAAGRCPRQTA